MTGHATGNNCDVNTDGNTGCGVQAPTANSYGPSFNANGGGWYAMERTNNFIKVWFFPRNSGGPTDLTTGAATINTDNWVCAHRAVMGRISLISFTRARPPRTSRTRTATSPLTSMLTTLSST